MPSILFINRVYPPESGATGRVLEHVAHAFVAAGWNVSVLATAGERSGAGEEILNGVKVIRVVSEFSKRSLVARALGYVWMIPSLLLKALLLPRADVVVTMTDPPMLLVVGPVLRFTKGSKLIHWAQDLYPEVAEEAGVFRRGGIVSGILRALSTFSLRAHHLVVSLGRCMSERLALRGVSPSRIILIPNLGMERGILPCHGSNNQFRSRHGIPAGSLVVMYSGNLGRAHEFSTVLEAARLLQERNEGGVLVYFVGEGPLLSAVRQDVAAMGLRNVRFLPSQPGEGISESLGSADLHLVTMGRGMSGLVVPSKFYGVLAAERACLFVGPRDSEVARVISGVGCGEVVGIGEGPRLGEVILSYRDHPGRAVVEGKRGRDWMLVQSDSGTEFLRCTAGLLAGGLLVGK